MILNTVSGANLLNQPLSTETAHVLIASALTLSLKDRLPCEAAIFGDIDTLRPLRRMFGQEVVTLVTPEMLNLLDGVTLGVYQYIEAKYCARLGQEIPTIAKSLERMAESGSIQPVRPEAVSIICAYLERKRTSNQHINTERVGSIWYLHKIPIGLQILGENKKLVPASIICVINETETPKIIGHRISSGDDVRAASLAVYDAICCQRYSSPGIAGGQVWRMPNKLLVDPGLPIPCVAISGLSMFRNWTNYHSDWAKVLLLRPWWQDLAAQTFTAQDLETKFDHYLFRFTGFAPRNSEKELDERNRSAGRLTKDPAEIFPDLQQFLPEFKGTLDEEGTLNAIGFHFFGEELSLWRRNPVRIRMSEKYSGRGWLYLPDQGFLSEISAQEYLRKDGSFVDILN